jgi:hypothetical protein
LAITVSRDGQPGRIQATAALAMMSPQAKRRKATSKVWNRPEPILMNASIVESTAIPAAARKTASNLTGGGP